MKEKEIEIDGEKVKIVAKLPKEYIEDNNLRTYLDNTIDLNTLTALLSNTSKKDDKLDASDLLNLLNKKEEEDGIKKKKERKNACV